MRVLSKQFGLAVALLALAGVSQARAGLTASLDSVTPSGSEFTWNYSITIASDDRIEAGDFFRIYDFAGYVAGSITAPAGWTVATENLSPTPPPDVLLTRGDSASIPNLIFTYTGATFITGPPATTTGITGFSARSIYGRSTEILKDFVGRVTKNEGTAAGTDVDSIGDVAVPSATAVPEPSSLVLMGLGAAGCLMVRRRRLSRA